MIATIYKMDMSIVEAGKQELALCVQHFGLGAMPRIHVRRAANSNNSLTKDGQRFCVRARLIDGPDFCVGYDEIGRRLCLGASHEVAHQKDQRVPQNNFGNLWQFWHFWQSLSLSPFQLGPQYVKE